MMHHKLIDVLSDLVENDDNPFLGEFKDSDFEERCRILFLNFRGDSEQGYQGLRLSDEGIQIMKLLLKCYDTTMPEGYKVPATHLIYLERVSIVPYFITDKHFATFDPEFAMMLSLSGNNIQNLIDSRFRLTQDGEDLRTS